MTIDTIGLKWAQVFHETYERLAPQFGYETRTDTRQFESESKNGQLMIAVCGQIIAAAQAEAARAQMEADCAAVCKLCQSSEDHDTAERANEMLWRHRGKTRHGNGYDHGVCAASPIRAAYAAANPEPQP